MQTYTTLDGRTLDLTDLTAGLKAYFERCVTAFRQGMDWLTFSRLVEGTDNPLVREAGGRITREVWGHPLYQAVRDMEDRLGVAQGELLAEPGDETSRDPLADDWLPVSAAAAQKGVTVPGLHKAIARGDVIAHPQKAGGTWLFVSANSLARWTPNPVRQAARRKRGALVAQ